MAANRCPLDIADALLAGIKALAKHLSFAEHLTYMYDNEREIRWQGRESNYSSTI